MKGMLKQKIAGVLLSLASIASVFIDGDATACVFLLPLGLYATFTKEIIFDFN